MMKKTIITVVLISAVVAAGGVALVSAQAADVMTHNTSWAFQNLGTTTAHVHVDLYSTAGGAPVAQDDFDVAKSVAFWAPTYAPLNPVGTFNGAIVASSSEPLAATVNQVAANSTSHRTGNATYGGLTSEMVAPKAYVPVVMKGYGGLFWTELSIQSTATSGDITAKVHYYNSAGAEVTGSPKNYTVHPGSVTRVAQANETILSSGFIGSVMVEAANGTTPIGVVVNEFIGLSKRMYEQFYSYEAFTAGSTRVVVPNVFINGYGSFNASVSVQNLGGVPAQVTWRFYDTTPGNPNPGQQIYSFSEQLAKGKSVYFPFEPYANTLKNAYMPGDNAWVGTLILESTNSQPLVAVVNQLSGKYLAASFCGLTKGSTQLYFPMAYVKAYGFADTSYAIVDMSGTAGPVNVTVEFIADTSANGCPTCKDWTTTYSFTNNDNKYQPTQLPASVMAANGSYIGSIKMTVNTAGKTINGVMNELMGGDTQDNLTSFNGSLAPSP